MRKPTLGEIANLGPGLYVSKWECKDLNPGLMAAEAFFFSCGGFPAMLSTESPYDSLCPEYLIVPRSLYQMDHS